MSQVAIILVKKEEKNKNNFSILNKHPFKLFERVFLNYTEMKRFNIRVYGLLIDQPNQQILVSKEIILGQEIIKFPGGGLEFDEGIADCLKREWMEEAGLEIEILEHFYTNDFFQKSAWDDS